MRTLQKFIEQRHDLELVKNDEMHRALHQVSPDWYIFIARDRGVVEVHDTSLLEQQGDVPSHIMTEQHVTWKIVHDAIKYNSNNFDAARWFEEQDKLEDQRLANKADRDRLNIRKTIAHALMKNN